MTALDLEQMPRYLMDENEQARADFLASLPLNFLQCRADGHILRTTRGYGVVVTEWRGRGKRRKRYKVTYVNWAWRRQECDNCNYEVDTRFNQTMKRLGASPNYEGCVGVNENGVRDPEAEYLLKGHGRISPSEARRELWRRQAGEPPPADEIVEPIEEDEL
jgi:hypothetical protein